MFSCAGEGAGTGSCELTLQPALSCYWGVSAVGSGTPAWEDSNTGSGLCQPDTAQGQREHPPAAEHHHTIRPTATSTELTAGSGACPQAAAPRSPPSSSSSQELLVWQLQGPLGLCQQDDATWTSPHGTSFSPHHGLVQIPSLAWPNLPASGQGSPTSPQPGSGPFPCLC